MSTSQLGQQTDKSSSSLTPSECSLPLLLLQKHFSDHLHPPRIFPACLPSCYTYTLCVLGMLTLLYHTGAPECGPMPMRLQRFLESIPSAGTEYGSSFEAPSTWALLPARPAPASEPTPHLHQIWLPQRLQPLSRARGTWPSTWIPSSSSPASASYRHSSSSVGSTQSDLSHTLCSFRGLFILPEICGGTASLRLWGRSKAQLATWLGSILTLSSQFTPVPSPGGELLSP